MKIAMLVLAALLSGCAGGEAMRTSANTMQINASAAPACGSLGAARVAEKTAAIETIKAGYDRYIITNGTAQNNVAVLQSGGQFNTTLYGNSATTFYTPGATIVAGSHDQSLSVVMFKNGDPSAGNALDARTALGEHWEDVVKYGIQTCLGG
jgi:hypothetical protein